MRKTVCAGLRGSLPCLSPACKGRMYVEYLLGHSQDDIEQGPCKGAHGALFSRVVAATKAHNPQFITAFHWFQRWVLVALHNILHQGQPLNPMQCCEHWLRGLVAASTHGTCTKADRCVSPKPRNLRQRLSGAWNTVEGEHMVTH